MNDLLNSNEYSADQTRIAIVKTYRESTVMLFNSYPDALRLFASFAERTVVTELNDTLLVTEETETIRIPTSSEGAVNALATGPTFEMELTAVQLRFYKNQFDVDEKVINSSTAQARTRLSMLAIVFAVELQSSLEIFRALRSALHTLDADIKKITWQNIIRQIGSGMLRENDDTEGAARILQLRNLIVTADRDFSDIPHDQLFGIIVDWKTAGAIGVTSEVNNQNDLLKIANQSLLKVTSPMRVGDVIVESIPPYYKAQIQNDTALTLEYPIHLSFAGFVPIPKTPLENEDVRIYFPDYMGGAYNITVTAAQHQGKNLLVVIRDVTIRGSSHIVVFGRDKPVALAETANTNVRGGPDGAIDPRNGMGYVSASRFVGATCIRRRNVVEFLSRVVTNVDSGIRSKKKVVLGDYGATALDRDANIYVLRTDELVLPDKDVFDLVEWKDSTNTVRPSGLIDAKTVNQFWIGKKTELLESTPLGFALSMPIAVSLDKPPTAVFVGGVGTTAGASLTTNTFLNFSPCHGPGLTLAAGVEGQYQGASTVCVPTIEQLTNMYASSYHI